MVTFVSLSSGGGSTRRVTFVSLVWGREHAWEHEGYICVVVLTGEGRLAVVGVDLQGGVHADREPLLRGVHRLLGGVGPCVADDVQMVAVGVCSVRDEHDVLVPSHQMALAGGPAHDEPLW
eukprot:945866-Prorocentrum_minimum.AAC.10